MLLSSASFDVYDRPMASGSSHSPVRFAIHKQARTLHAVKRLPHTRCGRSDADQRALVANELSNHAAVSASQHVCSLKGTFASENATCAVLELCTGGTLQDLLDLGQPKVDERAILRALLQALGSCCEAHVVHGDVAPHNIMFASQPAAGGSQLRLIDFGASSSILNDRPQCCSKLFATPLYAAPEVLALHTHLQLSDVWSAGIILLQLLRRQSRPEPLLLSTALPKLWPPELPAGTPGAATDLARHLLQPDPDRRLHPFEALGHPFFRAPG